MARKDLNLREWLGLLLIALVMVASAVLSIRNTQELATHAQWVAHTLEVKNQAHDVMEVLVQGQNASRGYIITGDSAFLQSEAAIKRFRTEFSELRALVFDNAQQQALLDSIDHAASGLWTIFQERDQRVVAQGRNSITARDIHKGETLMDDLRAALSRFSAEEDRLLREREQVRADAQRWSVIAAILAACLGVLLLAVFTRNLVQANALRARNAAEAFEREQWFRTTLASVGDAVVTTDGEARVTFLNAVAEELTGWKNKEAIGQPLDVVFHIINEFDRRPVNNPAIRAIKDGVIVGLANHTILIAKDGQEHHIDDSAAPIKDTQGTILGCVLIFRDIGERRSSEAAATQLAAIVASSDDAIISKNLQGIIQTWNKGAQTLFGYTAEEAVGQPATLLIPQDRQDEEPEILRRIAAGTTIDHYETVRRRKDGSLVDVSLTISPIRDGEGNITGASKIARDITDRKRAEEKITFSERRMRHALAAARMGSFIYHPHEDRSESDPQMLAHFGLPPDSPLTLSMAMSTLIDPNDRQRYFDAVGRSLDPTGDGLLHEEIHVIHPDGSECDLLISAHVAFEGAPPQPTVMSGVCMDITERKRTEQRLRQQAADLSETNRRKNEFLAMLAHELRNPLAPIRNSIELLRMPTNGDGEHEAALRMMARQTDQLARLVDDLLDVSRVSLGKIALRTAVLDLASVMLHATESAKQAAAAAGQTLEVTLPKEPFYVKGDEARLKQVLDNLLNNAMKFTPHGGHITLNAARRDKEAIITVRDNGIGISPNEIDQIFGLFVQSDSSLVRSTSGLGIGLTLVKTLVELHGGSITAQSEGEGKGSTFTVRVPLVSDPALIVPTTPLEQPTAPAQRRILVVDDNRDAAASLKLILTRSGHTVRTAFDGLEAVATAATFQPEVILLDIGLPNLNGYEVAMRIRKETWGTDIFLVALTGWGQDEDRNKSSEAGFDMHLVKPVDLAQLKTLLAGPLERAS